jgi:hypothetical protein
LIHGLLHLLGYDHERSVGEARRMFARERELAARLAEADTRQVQRRAGRSRIAAPCSIPRAGRPPRMARSLADQTRDAL